MNLNILLTRIARSFPDRTAIAHGPSAYCSYGELAQRAAALAGSMRSWLNLDVDGRVGLFMTNCPQYLEVFHGVLHAGMTTLPINNKLHEKELAYILEDADACAAFVSPDLAEKAAAAIEDVGAAVQMIVVGEGDYAGLLAGEPVPLVHRVPDDLAWLCFSPRNVEASEQPLREWYGPGRAWNRCTVEGGAPLVAQGDGVGPPSGRVVLERGSSNRLVFDIETRRPAWLVTALPRSEGWQARVDGRPVVTHRSDALFTAVAVPQGQSVVDLRYWSWAAFLGALAMALSSMVLVVLAARRCFEGRRRVITVAIGVGGCVVLFGLWWASLHHGPSYGTHYEYGFGWQEGGSSPAD